MHCGDKLKAAMTRQGCSGVELAKRMGKTPQQISRWRSQANLSLNVIVALADALEVDVTDFLK